MRGLQEQLRRWKAAGLIDADTAARIERFEARAPRSRAPALLALALGALMLGAGLLLFVAAHWDRMSPATRFGSTLAMVGALHLGAAFGARRWPALATALHGVGTAALGGGIFLAGQIFNLAEHWPSGLLLWALGAVAGALLLRDWVQLALAAVLVPGWLLAEWTDATSRSGLWAGRLAAAFLVLLALAYLSAVRGEHSAAPRRALGWLGAILVLPAGLFLAVLVQDGDAAIGLSGRLGTVGWAVAVGLPSAIWLVLRGREAWPLLLAVGWTVSLALFPTHALRVYPWCGLGAAALIAWGLLDGRRERIDLGLAGFATALVFFYFSSVMDRLGRAAGLVGLGALFLAGGWALERVRRTFVGALAKEAP